MVLERVFWLNLGNLYNADSDGSVPLWEAMLGDHKSVVKLLSDNGAKLTAGDVGLFSCMAAEHNNLDLLKEIFRFGGDVTQPQKNGCTALHRGVCEGNIEIVKFLLDQGAKIDHRDENNWTARDLAEQQDHEDIKELFDSYQVTKVESVERHGVRFLGRYRSDSNILPANQDVSFLASPDGLWGGSRPRRKINNFYNSLYGIMSAAQGGEHTTLVSGDTATITGASRTYATRVKVSCPGKGDFRETLVLLPHSFQELHEIGEKKYREVPTKILNKDGVIIDDIDLIRDGDHIVFVCDNSNCEN